MLKSTYEVLESIKSELKELKEGGVVNAAMFPTDSNGNAVVDGGTILTRLESVGFKVGSVSTKNIVTSTTLNSLNKTAKNALLNLTFTTVEFSSIMESNCIIGTVPDGFKPKTTTYVWAKANSKNRSTYGYWKCKIEGNNISFVRNEYWLSAPSQDLQYDAFNIELLNIGYEVA